MLCFSIDKSALKSDIKQLSELKAYYPIQSKVVTTNESTYRFFTQVRFKSGHKYKIDFDMISFSPYTYASSVFFVSTTDSTEAPTNNVDILEPGVPPTEMKTHYTFYYEPSRDVSNLFVYTRTTSNSTTTYTVDIREELESSERTNLTTIKTISYSQNQSAWTQRFYYPCRMVKGATYKVHLRLNDFRTNPDHPELHYFDIRTNRKENTVDIAQDIMIINDSSWHGLGDYWVTITCTESANYLYIYSNSRGDGTKLGFDIEIQAIAAEQYYQDNEYPSMMIYGIGDSIMTTTYGWFMDYLNSKYNVSFLRYAEGSTGYSTNNNVSSKTTFYNRVATMANEAPDLVLIEGGTNDFGKNKTIAETIDGVERTIINLHSKYPNTMLLGILPTQRYYSGTAEAVRGMVNDLGVNLIDYVDAIKSVFDKYGFPTVDLCRNGGLNELNVAALTIDGLHWTQSYHEHIADIIYPVIKCNACKLI